MKRYLSRDILELALERKKMAFISGPRQVGKTTLSKSYMDQFQQAEYKNWDESQFRRLWTKSPNLLRENFKLEKVKDNRLLILDEIHKGKGWKQKLKGLYDELGDKINIIVTGSARLNIFKKGGDSLMGRYINFRLHPFTYGEVCSNEILEPDKWKKSLFNEPQESHDESKLIRLLNMSGFPEPYIANSTKILKIWRQSRNEKIVREDLRDLSRIPELSQVEMLTSLLPEKIGSPLSVQSLREDLEVSHDTVRRWLNYLIELYYTFEIKPWSKSVPRSLKKEGKIYLYDWTEVENAGSRFENLIACHLQKACHYWSDTGEGQFELFYLRNKEKEEIDFLIIKDKKPWLMIEAKNKDTTLNKKVVDKFIKYFQCPYIQVVNDKNVFLKSESNKLIISAVDFLAHLP